MLILTFIQASLMVRLGLEACRQRARDISYLLVLVVNILRNTVDMFLRSFLSCRQVIDADPFPGQCLLVVVQLTTDRFEPRSRSDDLFGQIQQPVIEAFLERIHSLTLDLSLLVQGGAQFILETSSLRA